MLGLGLGLGLGGRVCGTQLGAGDRLAALPLSPETFEALCAQRKSRVAAGGGRVRQSQSRPCAFLSGSQRLAAVRRARAEEEVQCKLQ